jgi:hypothetical protein
MTLLQIFLTIVIFGYLITQTQEKLQMHELGKVGYKQINALIRGDVYSDFTLDALDPSKKVQDPSKSARKYPMNDYDHEFYDIYKSCFSNMNKHVSSLVDSGVSIPNNHKGNQQDSIDYASKRCMIEATDKLLEYKNAEVVETCISKLSDPILDKKCYGVETVLSFEDKIGNFQKIREFENGIEIGRGIIDGHRGTHANTSLVLQMDKIILSLSKSTGEWNGSDITPESIHKIADFTDNLLKKGEHAKILGLVRYVAFTTDVDGHHLIRFLFNNGNNNVLTIVNLPNNIFKGLQTTYGEITEEAKLPHSLYGKSPNTYITQPSNMDKRPSTKNMEK